MGDKLAEQLGWGKKMEKYTKILCKYMEIYLEMCWKYMEICWKCESHESRVLQLFAMTLGSFPSAEAMTDFLELGQAHL